MDRYFHTFDYMKSYGSPLGITKWNIPKIKVSNVKALSGLKQYEVILGGKNFLQKDSLLFSRLHAAFSE